MTRGMARKALTCGIVVMVGSTMMTTSLTSAAAAAGHGSSAERDAVTKQKLISLGTCKNDTVRLRVSLARTNYLATQDVVITGSLANVGTAPCGFTGDGVGPQADQESQGIGPCGALPMEIFNDVRVSIWPGKGTAVSCPAMGDDTLGVGAHVPVMGLWTKTIDFSNGRPAPPGRYRLDVDGLSFKINLEG